MGHSTAAEKKLRKIITLKDISEKLRTMNDFIGFALKNGIGSLLYILMTKYKTKLIRQFFDS